VSSETKVAHTPEPWAVETELYPWHTDNTEKNAPCITIMGQVGTCIHGVCAIPKEGFAGDQTLVDMKHAVACVNACRGLNPEAVPGLADACKTLLDIIETPLAECVCDHGSLLVPTAKCQCARHAAYFEARAALSAATKGQP